MKKFLNFIDRINFKCILNILIGWLFILYFNYICIKYQITTFEQFFSIMSVSLSVSFLSKAFIEMQNNSKKK